MANALSLASPKAHAYAMLASLAASSLAAVFFDGIGWGLVASALAALAAMNGASLGVAIRRDKGDRDLPWCHQCGADLDGGKHG